MDLVKEFHKKVEEKNIDWKVCGLLSSDGSEVFSLGSDSKLIGRIFEIVSTGILQEIANENGYVLEISDSQTVYPDFTMHKGEDDQHKIAVDIKTTYRRFKKNRAMKDLSFTLGSYASFLRDGKKNIQYPYNEYEKHYVIGFVYSRCEDAEEGKAYEYDDISQMALPYSDVEFFVQEKHKIVGEKPGSGNTENIGSYKTSDIESLINGMGPFAFLGEDVYEDYWGNYPKYRAIEKPYSSIDGYINWQKEMGRDVEKIINLYDDWKEKMNG